MPWFDEQVVTLCLMGLGSSGRSGCLMGRLIWINFLFCFVLFGTCLYRDSQFHTEIHRSNFQLLRLAAAGLDLPHQSQSQLIFVRLPRSPSSVSEPAHLRTAASISLISLKASSSSYGCLNLPHQSQSQLIFVRWRNHLRVDHKS